MDSELKNAPLEITDTVTSIEDGNADHVSAKEEIESQPPSATTGFADPAKQRREKIKRLEARLQREIARDNAASRRERNGQLFVWGTMIEGVYRTGDERERDMIRQWAAKHLTDKRHLQRAELGFARVDGEKADCIEEAL